MVKEMNSPNTMKRILLLLIVCASYSSNAQPQPLISTREQLVDLIRELRKIQTPEGIEKLEQVELNGEKQWIRITQTKNTRLPV